MSAQTSTRQPRQFDARFSGYRVIIVDRMPRSYWKTPLRLAWRNVRGSGARTAFIVGAITISIATVTAISHGAAVVRQSLSDDRKVWLKGDVAVETSEPISDAQIRAFDAMK